VRVIVSWCFEGQTNCNVIDKFEGVIVIGLTWCTWSNSGKSCNNNNAKTNG